MGKKQEHEEIPELKPQPKSLRSKAAHFVSDLTTVFLNPISDKPSRPSPRSSSYDDSEKSQSDADDCRDSHDGPDTSSFTAFLYSLLASSESERNSNFSDKIDSFENELKPSSEAIATKENVKRKGLLSRGKHTLGKAFYQAAKIAGLRSQAPKASLDVAVGSGSKSDTSGNAGISVKTSDESSPYENLPETSEPSMLLTEETRGILYAALPVIVQGRRWMLLYSTWRHGISLSTLYRRSMLWPGLSLLVVGDRNGAVFGGLVEAPLKPNKRRYQGSNDSFVFSNVSGRSIIFRPTGMNRYFTLCSTDYVAMGGGGHFALYLDGELLNGSSLSSETYGNPCLAHSEDFKVKEVELWGFVYASKYDEILALSRSETPGICHW
ncbi:uncharacterized protein LOC127248625 isoform X1 [Andrographis paniculata]|uniref:uncharacterized protein LOC127248625 isoform X1 n=1 Tax=Andrographis paniculata TaxID=175694 RepID=UPI0021E73D13|nr:uncharacterized protein LOC127248625 isoform X1 [Andrographis paniculata]